MIDFIREAAKKGPDCTVNAIQLSVRTDLILPEIEYNMVGRLFESARQLPEDGYLCLKACPGRERCWSVTAYADSDPELGEDDLLWIFSAAEPSMENWPTVNDFSAPGRKLYALTRLPEEDIADINDESFRDRLLPHLRAFYGTLYDAEGQILLFVGRDENGEAIGQVALSIPGELSFRQRVAAVLAFPGLAWEELPGDCPASVPERLLTEDELLYFIVGEISALEDLPTACYSNMDEEKYFVPYDDYTYDDYTDDGDIPDWNHTDIEKLELSVRSYNCLRRANIHTVGELCAKSETQLRKVRNLGIKSFYEIIEKLRERSLSLREDESSGNEDDDGQADGGSPKNDDPVNGASEDGSTSQPNDGTADTGIEAFGEIPEETVPKKDARRTLEQLIGLDGVKRQVKRIEALARMRQDMKKSGAETMPIVLNMEFVGNPGTAKTTVARILAAMFHELGLLEKSKILEVGRADLVAKYVGQTAEKVKEVFESADGRLLFIDEAYSLTDDRRGSYGDEAIHTIVQEMENRRDRVIVVFAGYPKEMESFFEVNPGLRSRVPFRIVFEDYSPEEMTDIAVLEAKKRGFAVEPAAMEKILDICRAALKEGENGNGRFCRNLTESAVLCYAERVYGDEGEPDAQKMMLTAEDFSAPERPAADGEADAEPRPIGFRV